jgi:ribosomal protein S18 acetylase RimI-like enzyme
MTIEIRPATTDDWSAVRAIRLQALAEAPEAFSSTLDRELAFSEATWRLRVTTNPTYLAWDGDRTVGTATGYVDPEVGSGTVQLVAMYVKPGVRGTGCSHRLIDAVVAGAVAAGATRVLLDVTDVNAVAARCYRRYGFAVTGRRQSLRRAPDIGEFQMALDLTGPRS